jgi:translation initiation factor IF-2
VDDRATKRYERLMARLDSGGKRKEVKSKGKEKAGRSRSRDDEDEGGYFRDPQALLRRKRERELEKERLARLDIEKNGPVHLRLSLPPFISVGNLATLLRVRQNELIRQVVKARVMDSLEIGQILNAEDAGMIAMEFGFYPTADKSALDLLPAPLPSNPDLLLPKSPVVTIMGHVDHGKTTILDFLRKSSIAANEHGGITQHIGAFVVPLSSGKAITFLDTPGHAAFLTMRQRGANVTDIVVLVVAADDSVKPQTIEAIKHARAAKVPVIVAVNKIDKPEANLDRVKSDISSHGIEIEDYGGDTQVIPVSGKTGQGMQELEEAIITLSEILDHRAPTDGPTEGWIIEMSTKEFGRAATILVTRGTLRPGTIIVAGRAWAKVRTLRNEHGVQIAEAGPGTPVEVDGWRIPPSPGDMVLQAADEQQAALVMRTREKLADMLQTAVDIDVINEARREQKEHIEAQQAHMADLKQGRRHIRKADPLHGERIIEGTFVDRTVTSGAPGSVALPFVIKADVTGSAEAVVALLGGLGNNEVRAHVVGSSAGPLTESDVDLAFAARDESKPEHSCKVLAFNAEIDGRVRAYAEELGVEILEESIIYRLTEQVTAQLEARLPRKVVQRVVGEAEVLKGFEYKVSSSNRFFVAGCRVRNGLVGRGSKVRIVRDGRVVYTGMSLPIGLRFFVGCGN